MATAKSPKKATGKTAVRTTKAARPAPVKKAHKASAGKVQPKPIKRAAGNSTAYNQLATLLTYVFVLLSLIFMGAAYYAYI